MALLWAIPKARRPSAFLYDHSAHTDASAAREHDPSRRGRKASGQDLCNQRPYASIILFRVQPLLKAGASERADGEPHGEARDIHLWTHAESDDESQLRSLFRLARATWIISDLNF